ncbi:MAG TPA: carboxymuconolactone decarboxylase family protein [Dongiaceae bacterium]|nr:carboxymuconolactone decarboxylase family protein [Dongiaceae bacterium]
MSTAASLHTLPAGTGGAGQESNGHGERLSYPAFKEANPEIYAAMVNLSAKASEGLEKDLVELVKLRASQINGCAFCLHFHLTLARNAKVPAAKLDLLVAWRDAGIFSSREQAALAWAETLTKLAGNTISDADYQAVRREFSEKEVAHLSAAIGVINVWNRISTGFAFAPQMSAA